MLGMYRSAHRLDRQIELLDVSKDKPDWKLIEQAALSVGRIGQQSPRAAIVNLVKSRGKLLAIDPKAGLAVNAAIIAGGELGADEILPACDSVLAENPMTSDGYSRLASAFAIGAAGTPNSPEVNRLFGLLSSPIESSKLEIVKAIGNLKMPGAEGRIKEFPMSDGYVIKWMIQWATARITGEPAEHPVPVLIWTARSSISDLPRN